MHQRRIRTNGESRRLAQWFLIFAVAAGVVAMHVFGHPADRTDPMTHMAGAESAAIAPALMTHQQEPQATGTEPMGTTGAPATDGMDPSAVCLAVLVAALLLPALRRSALWAPFPLRRLGTAGSEHFAGLPPPWAPSLQNLSVLRL